MAEDKKQTAGEVLKRVGKTPWNVNQADVAMAVKSGVLSRADVNTLTSWQLGTLGQKGYEALYPEVFTGGGAQMPRATSSVAMEIAALQALKNSFIGVGMEIYRTMIDNRITSLRKQTLRVRRYGLSAGEEQDFPLPDWMRPLLGLPSVQAAEEPTRRGRFREEQKPSTISAEEARGLTLSSLGAQTELDVDQQKYLSSFLAWQKAGAPSGTGTGRKNLFMETIQRMAQGQGDYWAEAQRKWQSMFPPSQRLGVQKRIASQ